MDLFLAFMEKHLDVFKTSDHADIYYPSNGSMPRRNDQSLLSKAVLLQESEVTERLLGAGWAPT
jgi:hypothetical protein